MCAIKFFNGVPGVALFYYPSRLYANGSPTGFNSDTFSRISFSLWFSSQARARKSPDTLSEVPLCNVQNALRVKDSNLRDFYVYRLANDPIKPDSRNPQFECIA